MCAALGAAVAYKGTVLDLAATDVSFGTILMVEEQVPNSAETPKLLASPSH